MLRCQAGDKEAFDELLRSVQVKLWRYISNLAGHRDLAEDILQEVFLIIYRKIGWLNDPGLFRPWAYRIASREAFRALKRQAKRREDCRDDEMLAQILLPDTETEFDDDMIAKLPGMLGRVSPSSRAVLMLHYLEEMSLNDTAEVLDISVGTAKSRLAYGLTNLRRQIKETKSI